ncbi:hypothetical protein CEXT_257631 [Caerostris extrusa]|uniref:Uncharacterized protein n=1 Tax=Caerostris extrusa TaxID=172846 RepID=A0AAV4MWB4_CAEEX|nr:hypothetical protein CEXT_257631 [Caerostris extrusa]
MSQKMKSPRPKKIHLDAEVILIIFFNSKGLVVGIAAGQLFKVFATHNLQMPSITSFRTNCYKVRFLLHSSSPYTANVMKDTVSFD